MLASPTTEHQLIDQLLNALRELPEVHAELDRWEPAGPAGECAHDARIDLRGAGKSVTLLLYLMRIFLHSARDVGTAFHQ